MQKPLPMDERKESVIWLEWERGTPMSDIARAIEKPPATVFSYLQYHGGIQPHRRQRRPQALAREEREEISRGIGVLTPGYPSADKSTQGRGNAARY